MTEVPQGDLLTTKMTYFGCKAKNKLNEENR